MNRSTVIVLSFQTSQPTRRCEPNPLKISIRRFLIMDFTKVHRLYQQVCGTNLQGEMPARQGPQLYKREEAYLFVELVNESIYY